MGRASQTGHDSLWKIHAGAWISRSSGQSLFIVSDTNIGFKYQQIAQAKPGVLIISSLQNYFYEKNTEPAFLHRYVDANDDSL